MSLSDEPEVGGDHGGDDGIAARRLMLCEEDDRRAARGDLYGTGYNAGGEDLAFASDDPRPAQARAHSVARGFDPEFGAKEQGIGLIGETLRVRTRDGAYLSGVVIRTEGGTTRPLDVQAGDPERQDLPGAQRAAETGRQIGRAAPKDRFGDYAPGHGEVGEPRAFAADDGEGLARTGERRGPARHEAAPSERDVAPGHGDNAAVLASEGERIADDLDGGRIEVVADERLRGGEGDGICGTRRRNAFPKMTEPTAILDGRA